MRKVLVLAVGLFSVLAVHAADGWRTNGGDNWNTASYWKDGVVAGGEPTDTAYLHYEDYRPTITLTEDVVLNAVKATGKVGNASFRRTGTAAFQMRNNPLFHFMPGYNIEHRTYLYGEKIFQGDGTVLTIQGGVLGLSNNEKDAYSISGFSRVDIKDQPSFTILGVGGIADGPVRLVNTYLNLDYNNGDLTATNNLFGGKLTIGPGLSYSRIGNTGANRLPAEIDRERAGVLNIIVRTRNDAYSFADGASFLNHEGRFPTWFSYGGDFNFLTYNAEKGLTNADLAPNVTFTESTKDNTVILSSATTLAADATAAAVDAKSTLDLAGHTLTLGNENEPGLLIMRADANGATGEVTFHGEEGIIISAGGSRRLKAKLTGANSVTVVAGHEGATHCLYLDNPLNTFSGGLDVVAGNLSVTNAGSLGTGLVKVHGYPMSYDFGAGYYSYNNDGTRIWRDTLVSRGGGTLSLNGCTITNDLSLSGMGIGGQLGIREYSKTASALYLMNNSGVKSAITLENSTAIRTVANGASEFKLEGSVTGEDWTLHLWPGRNSTMKFSNTILADAIAITAPTNGVRPRDIGTVMFGASLNADKLRNDATLMFEGSHTLASALTGEGSYKQTSDIAVEFENGVDQKGGMLIEKGTVTLKGAENNIGGLAGAGTLNVGSTLTLTLGSSEKSYDGYFKGAITTSDGAELTLVKTGTNTQILAGANTFNGKVVVEEGVLKLGGLNGALPKTVFPAQIHVDATDASSVQADADGKVGTWLNKGAVQGNFFQNAETLKPVYDPGAMDGRGGIVFDASDTVSSVTDINTLTRNRLYMANESGDCVSSKIGRIYMAFSVYRQTYFGGPLGKYDDDAGIRFGYGNSDKDFSIERAVTRASSRTHLYRLNDKNTNSGSCNKVYTFEQDVGEQLDWCVTLGSYFNFNSTSGNVPRAFKGAIGEILTYPEALNPQEEYAVRAYFNDKWGIVEDAAMTENVLPVGSTLTVQKGAVVDFAGVSQALAKLENFGTIRNSSETQVVITVNDAVLVGAVEGNVKIVVDGGTATVTSWRNLDKLPVTRDLVFHLDGADLSTLLRDADGLVTNWLDKSGRDIDFKEDRNVFSGYTLMPPRYDESLNDGRGAVVFYSEGKATDTGNRLSTGDVKCEMKSVFFLMQPGTKGNEYCTGLFGPRDIDGGVRFGNVTGFNPHGGSYFTDTVNWYVNGVREQTTFNAGERFILETGIDADALSNNKYNQSWALGQYYGTSKDDLRGYNGNVSEVIAYNRYVDDDERALINGYLKKKWMTGEAFDAPTFPDTLSFGFKNGGTLDLGNTTQTISGLSGSEGAIVNGDLTVRGVLEVVADENGEVTPYQFNGVTLADGLTIILRGTPNTSRFVIATGVTRANTSTFRLPSSAWTVSLRNGDLSMSKNGMVLIFR